MNGITTLVNKGYLPYQKTLIGKTPLGIITHKYPIYRAYIGISHRGTLVGVHPTIS